MEVLDRIGFCLSCVERIIQIKEAEKAYFSNDCEDENEKNFKEKFYAFCYQWCINKRTDRMCK